MPSSCSARAFTLLCVAAAALLLAVPRASLASPRAHESVTAGYINPVAGSQWQPSRTDMGVDWMPTRPMPVRAIGDAVILGSTTRAPWPGKGLIWYQLQAGSHAGDVVYVAENLRRLARAGTQVKAGQQIGVALASYPYTEWGWADQYGTPLAYPCYKNGRQTPAGREMARFFRELGATTYDDPGAGIDHPTPNRCSRAF